MRNLILSITGAGLLFAAAGCAANSSEAECRPAGGQHSGENSGDATDAMADGDARRAKEAMEARDDESRGQRPAAPAQRRGSGVVDQPKPGARP